MSNAHAPKPPPSWFALLPILAMVVWWPWSPSWQSDDFIAMHYAQDLGRALSDFAGPQYGATDLWWFYRPLVTLSFWVDQVLGGADPFVAHANNVVAHGFNALLAGLLWRRFLPDAQACLAGALWAIMPSHAGSIAWAVGRVDGHATLWCLLALWLFARRDERLGERERAAASREQRSAGYPVDELLLEERVRQSKRRSAAWPMMLALAAALCTKELAMVVPPLAAMLAFVRMSPAPIGVRTARSLRRALPLFAVLLVYLPYRLLVLGRFGGYSGFHFEPSAMLWGFVDVTADLLVPLRWIGLPDAMALAPLPEQVWLWIAALPFVAVVVQLAKNPRWFAAIAVYVVALVPMAGLLSADHAQNLRIYYLPTVALAGLLAAPGPVAVLVLLAWANPLMAMRHEQHRVDVASAAMHKALVLEANEGTEGPMFVAGLPHANPSATAIQFHFGVDRMLQPPFSPSGQRLFALRPLDNRPDVFRLETHEGSPFPLPAGSTWYFIDSTGLGRVPPGTTLPELEVADDVGGVLDLTSPRLREMARAAEDTWQRNVPSFGLRTPGVRPQLYRITVFTANGYLCLYCPDHAAADSPDGAIDMLRFFAGSPQGHQPARYGPDKVVGDELLLVPTTIDLVPEFPVLIEAGSFQGPSFLPSHRARRMITFRFDREYPAWVRLVQGTDR